MSASRQVHVDRITFVTTLLDHTHVNVHWDLLRTLANKIHWIQFVLVRSKTQFDIKLTELLFDVQVVGVKASNVCSCEGVVRFNWTYPNFLHLS